METVHLTCQKCFRKLLFPADSVGKIGRCAGCGTQIRIQPPPTERMEEPAAAEAEELQPVEVICAFCRRPNTGTARFCRFCGNDLRAPSRAIQNAQVDVAIERAATRRTRLYAGFWLRFAAFIVDAIVLTVGIMLCLAAIYAAAAANGTSVDAAERFYKEHEQSVSLVASCLACLYYALMESSSLRGTLGKRALGIMVTDMSGERIGFLRALGRHLAKFISALPLCIGYLLAGLTQKKQALHDMLAGCLVVKR